MARFREGFFRQELFWRSSECCLVLAWGLFEREPWARFLGLALGFLALLRFPLGTALGIYTLWVLLPEIPAASTTG